MLARFDPASTAWFLDVDGTLVDLAPTPDGVTVPATLPSLLERLSTVTSGALALVSGRALADLEALLPGVGVTMAGDHGAVVRFADGGKRWLSRRRPLPRPLVREIQNDLGQLPGVLVEDKQTCLTVHYRQAPGSRDQLRRVLEAMAARCGTHELTTAHMAFELRPRGGGKGVAVARLMQTPPFRGRRPVFIGDDVTDEDGIRAALLFGGVGLRVAQDFAGEPAAVRRWLAAQAEAGIVTTEGQIV